MNTLKKLKKVKPRAKLKYEGGGISRWAYGKPTPLRKYDVKRYDIEDIAEKLNEVIDKLNKADAPS